MMTCACPGLPCCPAALRDAVAEMALLKRAVRRRSRAFFAPEAKREAISPAERLRLHQRQLSPAVETFFQRQMTLSPSVWTPG